MTVGLRQGAPGSEASIHRVGFPSAWAAGEKGRMQWFLLTAVFLTFPHNNEN